MGVHVKLAVFADRVSDDVWQTIYEKARRVAKQWTPRPLATAWRHIGEVRSEEDAELAKDRAPAGRLAGLPDRPLRGWILLT